MKKRNWLIRGVALIIIIGLSVALGLCLNAPDEVQPVTVIGKVWQDNNYGGILGGLDNWDYPVTQCQVVLRYAGAEGTAKIEGEISHWSIYVSSGKIIDQVQVDEDGVYRFNLDWRPEGVFTGDVDQETTAILYQIEILTPVQGFYNQEVIGSSQIKVKIAEAIEEIQGPFFLLSR